MTTLSKDEILRLAREAGPTGFKAGPHEYLGFTEAALERFAHLCRADLVAENERLERALKDASVAAIAEALEVDALRAELSALRAGSGNT